MLLYAFQTFDRCVVKKKNLRVVLQLKVQGPYFSGLAGINHRVLQNDFAQS